MKAILWDGFKKLNGTLCVTDSGIDYIMNDFSETNLNFTIPYTEVNSINLHRVFQLELMGVEILTIDGNKNVFITDNPHSLHEALKSIYNQNTSLKKNRT